MATVRLILVVGLLASAVAIGLAFGFAALRGAQVTGDEIARHGLLGFVVATTVILVTRRRPPPPS